MALRVQVGGIYFGNPRGFGTNEKGERTGFNTMIYSEGEVRACACVSTMLFNM